jgi:hypothetical protein
MMVVYLTVLPAENLDLQQTREAFHMEFITESRVEAIGLAVLLR